MSDEVTAATLPEILLYPAESSTIAAMGYREGTLAIRFHSSTDVYRYADVPLTTWMSLQAADSIGSYFHRHIKGKYDFVKIPAEKAEAGT